METKSKALAASASVIATILLVYILVRQINVADIIGMFKIIPTRFIFITFALYVLTYLFRALRFKILLENELNVPQLFKIVALQTLITMAIPMRLGELSYVFLTKKSGCKGTKSLATLIIARVFDLFMLSSFLLLSLFFIKESILPLNVKVLVGSIAVFSLFAIISMIFLREKSLFLMEKILLFVGLGGTSIFSYITRNVKSTINSLGVIQKKSNLLATFLYSIASWALSFFIFYLLLISIGINLSIWQVIFFNIFLVFLPLLPIHGIGGFGTMESYIALMLMLFGIPKEQSIISSFVLHITFLVYTIVPGAICLAAFRRGKNEIKTA